MINTQYPIFKAELQRTYNRFWEHDQIQEMEFRHELGSKPSFRFCFGRSGINLTRAFIQDVKKRTKGNIPLSLVIQIVGKQGIGKSKLSFQIGRLISGVRFDENFIFMEREKLLSSLDKAKANQTYILDEQTMEFGEGSQRQLAELQNIQEVTRIKQIHFIYNSPTTRTHLAAHYSFKVLQKNLKHRYTKFAFCSNDFSHYLGYGLAAIPTDDDPLYKAYEPVKLAYVDKVLERKTEKYDVWELVKKLRNNKSFKYCRSKQDIKVVCNQIWPTMTTGEIQNIINAFFIDYRRRKATENARKLEEAALNEQNPK